MPTDEEFTALHFTVYHGNFALIKFLLAKGADHHKANKFGSTVMHVAAQGDQPLPLYYFLKVKGMDLNVRDKRQSTPLHWACYSRSEVALNYILSWGADLEAEDQ